MADMRRLTLAALLYLGSGHAIFGQTEKPNANHMSSDNLIPIQRNGKWGYADGAGRIIIKPQFRRASRFSDGLALVWTGGVALTDPVVTSFVKMGYINSTGHWVIHSRFEYYFFDDFSEGVVPFRKQSSKWGYMDESGKIVITPKFDWAGSFSGGVAPVLLEGECAHIDKTGKVLDQSQTILPRHGNEQDSRGTYQHKPDTPPCD